MINNGYNWTNDDDNLTILSESYKSDLSHLCVSDCCFTCNLSDKSVGFKVKVISSVSIQCFVISSQ